MENLLKYWAFHHYTGLIAYLLALVVFFISLRGNKQHPKLKPLSVFLAAYFLGMSLVYGMVSTQLEPYLKARVIYYSDFMETIMEFLAFFLVIKKNITAPRLRKALIPLLPVYILLSFIYFIYYKLIHQKLDQDFLQTIFTLQALILIFACVLYYIEVFTGEPKLKLTADPSFWALTGLSFFILSTLPFSFLGMYLVKANYALYSRLFSIFDIFYWILFLMIAKAYSCKPQQA